MTSSDFESDTLIDEPFSITNGLLMKPIYTEDTCESCIEASSNLTNKLIETMATYVPLVVQSMLPKKRPHGGSTIGRRYIPRDRITRHELILRDYFIEVIRVFEGRYLRKSNDNDIKRLLEENDVRDFPGMIGSLDYMHWHWSNCPKAWHGMHTNSFKKVPTLILEVVASKDMWIWHAFFGMASTNNDITVLDRSPLFDDFINGVTPPCQFEVHGHQYNIGYYLSDGIYPICRFNAIDPRAIKSKRKIIRKATRKCRKDVERAFRVLQKRWHIIKGSACMWKASHLRKIMKTCIILHNMITESEHHQGPDPERREPLTPKNVQNVTLRT